MKETLIEILEDLAKVPSFIIDGLYFAGFVILGTYFKIKKEQRNGNKTRVTVTWFLTELLMSAFIALLVLGILDYFLGLPRFLTFAICAFLGSISTTFHDKTEELVISVFDAVKAKVSTLINFNNKP